MTAKPSVIHGGFSLLELLAVIAIISIIITFATMSVSGRSDKAVEEEAKRLTALIKLASEESIMNSRDMILLLVKSGYAFALIDPMTGQIAPIDGKEDRVFRERELPEDIYFKDAEIAGEPVSLVIDSEKGEEPPKIAIMSSGDIVPFEITLEQDSGTKFCVAVDERGPFFIKEPEGATCERKTDSL